MKQMSIVILASMTLLAPATLRAQSVQSDQLYENLRMKLANAKSDLDKLKANMEAKAQHADQEVRAQLDQLQKRIEEDRVKVSAAEAQMKDWLEARKNETS